MAIAHAGGTAAGAGERARATRGVLGEPPTLLLIAAMLAAAAVILYETGALTFLLDEWTFLLYRRGLDAGTLLEPHNEHLVVIPVIIYKVLLELFGMDSARPFQVVSTATFLVSVAVLFAWLRARVGAWAALAGSVAVLFCGAAWEDLLWAFQIGYFGSTAAGLGALLVLLRGRPGSDWLACVLLVVAIGFSSLAIAFMAAAAVALVTAPEWRRRLYVVAVPAVLYGLWWIGWGHEATTHVSLTNIADSPLYVLDSIAAALSSLFGMATPRDEAGVGAYDWGRALAVAALALAAWRIHRLGTVPRWLWVVGALALSFWVLSAFNEFPGRDPSASRYQYVGVILVLLIAAELGRGIRVSLPAVAAGAAILALAVLSNLSFLHQSAGAYEDTSDLIRADLGAVEIIRDTVDPEFVLTEEIAGTGYVHVPVGLYLSAADAFGSPADSEAEVASAPEGVRAAADRVLAAGLGVAVAPASAAAGSGCDDLDLAPGGEAVVDLPVGGAVVRAAPGAAAQLRLRRFATSSFPIGAGELSGSGATSIAIPPDRSQRPWQLGVFGRGAVAVCPEATA